MCGIAGYINFNKTNLNFDRKRLLSLMNSRGPDDNGIFNEKERDFNLSLFHSRLTILDDNPRSSQPYKFKNYVLTFNGEIYNFDEIKKKLILYGYKFETTSDTEVVIKAFDKWKSKSFEKFDGMWSICIYDKNSKKIFLSRDRFGEKPLFYFNDSQNFIFGSEIKYLLNIGNYKTKILEKNKDLIDCFIKQGYRLLNKNNTTFFKNIFKVNPGENIEINILKKKIKKYFFFNKKQKNKNFVNNFNQKELNDILIKSVESRLISDFPIGFYLSGGIDSGSIASIASKCLNKKINCFSIIDKDERYNEEENIDLVTKDIGCETTKIPFPQKHNFLDRLSKLIAYHDGPIATPSYYAHSFIHEYVKKQGIKVLISGLGGDEMFSGYYDHYIMHLQEIKNTKFYNKALSDWKKYILNNIRNENLKDLRLFEKPNSLDYLKCEFNKNFIKKIFKKQKLSKFDEEQYSNSLLKNRMLNELYNESVPVICNEDDLNSMMHSIENRSPFLNEDLVKFVNKLNPRLFIKNGYNKYLLRNSVKNILIDKVRLDRKKMGFNVSISSLINPKGKEFENFFKKSNFLEQFINMDNFLREVKSKKIIDNKLSKLIFNLINVEIFLNQNS